MYVSIHDLLSVLAWVGGALIGILGVFWYIACQAAYIKESIRTLLDNADDYESRFKAIEEGYVRHEQLNNVKELLLKEIKIACKTF